METTLSLIKKFGTSKEQIVHFAAKTVNEVRSGTISALDLKIYLKSIEKIIEIVDKETREEQLEEARKYGAKSFEHFGAKIEISEVGTKYDYANCNDSFWNECDRQMKELAEKKKNRESFLKTIQKPMQICDEETGGETIEINPAIKTSTTSLKITINK